MKIFSDAPASLNLDPFLSIFGRWRMENEHPAGWVDLADYAHVPRGPGIVLSGHRANFSFDLSPPGTGSLYFAKKGLTGSPEGRILAAIQAALEMSKRLAAEPEFPAGVGFCGDSLELRFPDRLNTPNTAATDSLLRPAVQSALDRLFTAGGYELRPATDTGAPYGFLIRAEKPQTLDALLSRLSALPSSRSS